VIELRAVTKRYGDVVAVDDLTFEVQPGKVTGFLGPNGAGKSTTMRMVLGLDRPSKGEALVAGRAYRELTEPLRHVGALLDAGAMHPGRTGRNHLRVAARSNGIPATRVDEVLGCAGLSQAADRRVKGYSLGMRQRLGIATALLGDPGILLFDEPVNGLDVDGVRWIRRLFRELADEGRTVLVSSHLMSEVQEVADHLVVIGRGRLLADASTEEVVSAALGGGVRVRTPEPDTLLVELRRRGVKVAGGDGDLLLVDGVSAREVGDAAYEAGVAVHELTEVLGSLEDAYLALTEGSGDHVASGAEA
jgi:ABC-2 type transport system ATP-binding protein